MGDVFVHTVVYATIGYVTSDSILQKLLIRPLNCFVLPELDMISPSRAYNPPTKAPILVPTKLPSRRTCRQGYGLLTSYHVNRDTILFQGTKDTLLHVSVGIHDRACMLTKCEIPRAPPPPRTTPIDMPHIRLANRAKSLECAGRCGRGSPDPPRYFLSSLCTRSFKFLNAAIAAGSCWGIVVRGIDPTIPWTPVGIMTPEDTKTYVPGAQHVYVGAPMVDSR